MVTFDETGGVYEAWLDSEASEYLGSFDSYTEARVAVNEAQRERAA